MKSVISDARKKTMPAPAVIIKPSHVSNADRNPHCAGSSHRGCGCEKCSAKAQTKLTVNQPGDRYEQEADLMAEHDVNQLPVVEGRDLVGILDRGDVMRYIQVKRDLSEKRAPTKASAETAPPTPNP